MDKMTDAKIRAWLKSNQPGVLNEYHRYQADGLAASPEPMAETLTRPLPLREWLLQRCPDILEHIPLW